MTSLNGRPVLRSDLLEQAIPFFLSFFLHAFAQDRVAFDSILYHF